MGVRNGVVTRRSMIAAVLAAEGVGTPVKRVREVMKERFGISVPHGSISASRHLFKAGRIQPCALPGEPVPPPPAFTVEELRLGKDLVRKVGELRAPALVAACVEMMA